MIEGLNSLFLLTLDWQNFLANLLMALLCGYLVSIAYRTQYDGPNYSAKFAQSLVALSMITALVIMVIGNNLARAFGLVGAMSIIRFRTAVKDTQDIVFIFFSLAAGLAAGVGLRLFAFLGTVLIGFILLLLSVRRYGADHKKDYLLQFYCSLNGGEPPYLPVLNRYCRDSQLAHIKSLGEDSLFEVSLFIRLKKPGYTAELLRELQKVPDVTQVRLFSETE